MTCKKGTLDESLTRTDVDKEFVLLFAVMDENKSWLLDENIKRFCTDPDEAMTKKADGGFVKSNKMYGINGRVFGNLEGLDMCLGDKISWHLYGIGTDTDVHSGIAFINPCKRLRPSTSIFHSLTGCSVYVLLWSFTSVLNNYDQGQNIRFVDLTNSKFVFILHVLLLFYFSVFSRPDIYH